MTEAVSTPASARDKGVMKAVALLKILRESTGGGSARELALATGIPRSTVQRLLSTLSETELVIQDPQDQRYRIGPLALWIGMGYRNQDLIGASRPLLQRLRDATGETAGLSVAVGNARVFVAEVQSRSGLRFAPELGRRYPLWSGSMGRVLMSELSADRVGQVLLDRRLEAEVDRPIPIDQNRLLISQAREDAYGTAFSETLIGTSSVAVGVRDADGDIVAAMSIGGPEPRLTLERMMEALPLLRAIAGDLGEQLGYYGAPTDEPPGETTSDHVAP